MKATGITNNVNIQGDTIQFKRDCTGKLSPNGKYVEKLTKLDVKYEEEARFCLCVGVVAYVIIVEGPPGEDGTLPLLALAVLPHMVGHPADLFDCSGKTILALGPYDKKVWDEVKRIKGISGGNHYWVENNRGDSELYADDDIAVLYKLGRKAMENLAKHGITTLAHVASMTDNNVTAILNDTTIKGLGKKRLNKWQQEASQAKETNAPDSLIVM